MEVYGEASSGGGGGGGGPTAFVSGSAAAFTVAAAATHVADFTPLSGGQSVGTGITPGNTGITLVPGLYQFSAALDYADSDSASLIHAEISLLQAGSPLTILSVSTPATDNQQLTTTIALPLCITNTSQEIAISIENQGPDDDMHFAQVYVSIVRLGDVPS